LLTPHSDPQIAPEARHPAFAKWVSSYFIHGDLSTHNPDNLTYDNINPLKMSTIETLKPEVLFSIVDFTPAEKYDNIVGLLPFESLVSKQTTKALGDRAVRGAWSGARFWNLYGSAEPWNIIYAAWFLQAPEFVINSKIIEGVNHFVSEPFLSPFPYLIFISLPACVGRSGESNQGAEGVHFGLNKVIKGEQVVTA
jgi:hypothetical protein